MTTLSTRPVIPAATPWTLPTPDSWSEENLRGLHLHVPGDRMLHVAVYFPAPLDEEPVEKAGLTEFMGQLLTEGTDELSGGEFAIAADRIAASISAGNDEDGAWLALEVPASRAEEGLSLFSAALTRPAFSDIEVERVRELRRADLAMSDADPAQRAADAFRAALHEDGSRAGLPDGGTAESLDQISAEDIRQRYSALFRADRATVVTAGGFTADEVAMLITRALSGWTTATAGANLPAPAAPRQAPPTVVFVDRPGSLQTELRLGTVTENARSTHWAGGTVAAYILAGGMRSRLNLVLREEKGYTYGARAALTTSARRGRLGVSLSVDTDVTGAALADAVAILDEFARTGPTADEQESAAEAVVSAAPIKAQTARALHNLLFAGVRAQLPDDWYTTILTGAARSDADTVGADYRALVGSPLTIVLVGDYAVCQPQLAEVGIEADAVI